MAYGSLMTSSSLVQSDLLHDLGRGCQLGINDIHGEKENYKTFSFPQNGRKKQVKNKIAMIR